MSGLFSALHVSSTALDAFTRALGVTQENVANASTPGYAAQRATIRPISQTGPTTGAGDVVTISSSGSDRADSLVQAASSRASSSQTSTDQLTPVNQLFDITGATGILRALQQFSAAFSALSVSPNDPNLRDGALTAGGAVASAFQQTTAGLDRARASVDAELQTVVGRINTLAGHIAGINQRAAAGSGSDPGAEANLRSSLEQLSSLVDITVAKSSDGTYSVLAGGQIPLVLGSNAFSLAANPQGPEGAQIASSAGGNPAPSFSGQLGALLDARNTRLGQLLGTGTTPGSLNSLAAGFASRVNALLTSGTTASGVAGIPLFSFDAVDPTNAARSLSMIPAVTADQLALSSGGAGGQANGIANQLAALNASGNAADHINGLSVLDLFSSIASGIGQQLSDARTQSSADQTVLVSVQAARAQQTGVSLDAEAVQVTALQRSYEAAARIFSIIDQLTSDEVNLIK